MADPHIQSPMDIWDYITVVIYRLGFVLAAAMLPLYNLMPEIAHIGLLVAGAMLASSLHLYMKAFRFLFQFAMWIALICQIIGYPMLALGAVFLTVGGLCYKEYFCFRVFALNFQPIILAVLWLAMVSDWIIVSYILMTLATVLLLVLSFQKWRMPLHFDIGDKSKYQI